MASLRVTAGLFEPTVRRGLLTSLPTEARELTKSLREAQSEGHVFAEAAAAENFKTGHRTADNVATLTRVASTAYGALSGSVHTAVNYSSVALVSYVSTKVASFRDMMLRSIELSAAGALRGKTALMLAGPPAGSAAIADAKAVYLAFNANNPLADVVLAHARTSYGELGREFSQLRDLSAHPRVPGYQVGGDLPHKRLLLDASSCKP